MVHLTWPCVMKDELFKFQKKLWIKQNENPKVARKAKNGTRVSTDVNYQNGIKQEKTSWIAIALLLLCNYQLNHSCDLFTTIFVMHKTFDTDQDVWNAPHSRYQDRNVARSLASFQLACKNSYIWLTLTFLRGLCEIRLYYQDNQGGYYAKNGKKSLLISSEIMDAGPLLSTTLQGQAGLKCLFTHFLKGY